MTQFNSAKITGTNKNRKNMNAMKKLDLQTDAGSETYELNRSSVPFFNTRHSILQQDTKVIEKGDLIFGSMETRSQESLEVEGFIRVDQNQVMLLNDSFNRIT